MTSNAHNAILYLSKPISTNILIGLKIGGRPVFFKFNGRFLRDKNYEKYSEGTEGLQYYERCKKENENKFIDKAGVAKERMILDALYCHKKRLNWAAIPIQLRQLPEG